MRIQTRNGTVSSGSNKVPLQKIPSKYSESSNRGGSRQSSGRSARSTLAVNESEEKERQMTGDLATSPKNGHLVP